MSMFPGAQISYGIIVPEMEGWPVLGEFPWWTEETELDHGDPEGAAQAWLKTAGIEGVHLNQYGDVSYTDTGLYIHTAHYRVYAYDAGSLTPEMLAIEPGDAPKLENAFHQLFGTQDHKAPNWIVTLTYG